MNKFRPRTICTSAPDSERCPFCTRIVLFEVARKVTAAMASTAYAHVMMHGCRLEAD